MLSQANVGIMGLANIMTIESVPPGLNRFSEMMMLSGTQPSKFRSLDGSNKAEREVEEGEEGKGCEDEGDEGEGDKGEGCKDEGDEGKGNKRKGNKHKGCEEKGNKDEGNEGRGSKGKGDKGKCDKDCWGRHVGLGSEGSSSNGCKIPESAVHACNRGIRKETGDEEESATGSIAIGSLIEDEVHTKGEGPIIGALDGESGR